MLTQQEEAFIRYWEENRSRQKKVFRQFLVGIPVGLAFAIPIVINFASGWDVQAAASAASSAASEKSLMMVLMVALLLIVGFIAIFYQKYKWDQYEQRYRELQSKRSNDPGVTPKE
jgi:sterol desaturase/sphingolipid hydroxylase (fatty acid hydroxylase superfamily)